MGSVHEASAVSAVAALIVLSILLFGSGARAGVTEKVPPATLAETACDASAHAGEGNVGEGQLRTPATPLLHADPVSVVYLIGLHPSRSPGGDMAIYRVCRKGANASGSCKLVFGILAQEHPVPAELSVNSVIPAIRPDESCRPE